MNSNLSFSSTDKKQATKVKASLDLFISDFNHTLPAVSNKLSVFTVKLVESLDKRYWLLWGYNSQKDYLESIASSSTIGRTQLYAYIGTIRDLSKYFSNLEIQNIGITKCKLLRTVVKRQELSDSSFKINDKVRSASLAKCISSTEFEDILDSEYPLPIIERDRAVYSKTQRKTLVYKKLGNILVTHKEKKVIDKGLDFMTEKLNLIGQPKSVILKEVLLYCLSPIY